MAEGPRQGQTLAVLALGVVSLCAGLEHAWWASSCTAPLVHGDSPRHALWALSWAQRELAAPSPLGLEVLGAPTYYPSFVAWLALPLMKSLGPTGALFRTSPCSAR